MREIEFRAWDKKRKVMHNNFQFVKSGDEGNDWILFVSDKNPINDYTIWTTNPYFSQQLEIMQYTGLKDKNGKEIYEGDCFGSLGGDKERPDEYEYWGYVYYDIDLASFCVNAVNGGWYYLHEYLDNNYCEVIGNKFDNPELMEVGK